MGRVAKSKASLAGHPDLFPDSKPQRRLEPTFPLETPAVHLAMAESAPAQTDAKSRLIAEYLARFQLVTRGGLYIDGFAAPQKREHPEAWTARRVLEIDPPRLRTFWLCDNDPAGVEMLRELKKNHHGSPPSRRVFVHPGDFNQRVDDIILSGRIRRRSAVFALLDQRNTECHWRTVQRLASYAGRTKIELLYFLGIGWLLRSLTQSKREERLAEIDLWWGGPSWRGLVGKTQIEISDLFAQRFQRELGYKFSNFWPIFLREDGKRKAFVLIHATDHHEAPKLMKRAYYAVYGAKEGSPTDAQASFIDRMEGSPQAAD